jgi:hypothetical protein
MTDITTQQSNTPAAEKKWKGWGTKLIKAILTILVIYYAGKQIVGNWDEVRAHHWQINWWLLSLSVALHLLAFALFAHAWCLLMRGFGYRVPLKHGFKIAYIANLGRYIPGRIWPIFGMVYVAKQMKISEQAAVASWGMALLFGMPPSFVVGFATILLYPQMLAGSLSSYVGLGMYVVAAATFLVSLILLFAPNLSLGLANFCLKLLKRPPIQFNIALRDAVGVYLGYMVGWIVYGLAFWIFLHAVIENPGVPLLVGIGSFIIAYQIGYLAIFTPGGLGARELVMIGLLTPYLGPLAAGIAVAARIWNTISDIIASAIALRLRI